MFQLWEAGGRELILKSHVKKWEYIQYGGRPELYPQDRRALLTMIQFRNEKTEHDQKHLEAQQKMKQRLTTIGGTGTGTGVKR
jgi:hypothetical protein